MWDNIIDGKLLAHDQPRPRSIGNTSDPEDWHLNAAGYYEQQRESDPPEGQQVTGWTWAGLQDNRSVYEPIYADIPPPILPEYPEPDVTVPLVDTNGTTIGTARILVDAETLQPLAVVNSASPQKPWTEQNAQRKEILAALKAERVALKAMYDALAKDSKLDKATKDAATSAASAALAAAVAASLVALSNFESFASA